MLKNIPLWIGALHSRATRVAPSPPEFHKVALPLQLHSALPAHMALCCSPIHRTPCHGCSWGTGSGASCMRVPQNLRGGPTLWNSGGTGSVIWAYSRGGSPDVFVSPISFSFLDGKNVHVHSLPSIHLVLFVCISPSWQFLLVYYSIHSFIFMCP